MDAITKEHLVSYKIQGDKRDKKAQINDTKGCNNTMCNMKEIKH